MPDYKKRLSGLIELTIAQGASDLHLGAGIHPTVRVSGVMTPIVSEPVLTNEDTLGIIDAMLSPKLKKRFFDTQEIDFSYDYAGSSPAGGSRFRGNGYFQRGLVGIALRLIPRAIRSVSELRLPSAIEQFALREQGFFLVVGPVRRAHGPLPVRAALAASAWGFTRGGFAPVPGRGRPPLLSRLPPASRGFFWWWG